MATYAGRFGDRAAVKFSTITEVSYDGEVSKMVRSRGKKTTVKMPNAERIEDINGYDPVSDETKKTISGKHFVFPKGMTVLELQNRVSDRLKQDYGVGYADVELDEKGVVKFVGLGRSVSGIGPTLGPGTCAVALRADPAYSSGAGDTVQLWKESEDGTVEQVAKGELRAAVNDVVTVALDETEAKKIDQSMTYRLVTLPTERGPEREFASMLRSADETMSVVTVSEDSTLVGRDIGSVDVPVVAVRTQEGEIDAVPEKTRVISAGEVLYVVGLPDEIRKLDSSRATE